VFKIETQEDNGLWHDVRGADGAPLVFESKDEARAKLEELFPVLVKMEKYAGGKRTHHIHMVEEDSRLWERLYFRDYLQEFPAEARRYAELKQSLAEKHPNDRVAYTEGKPAYITAVTERARRHYGTS